jgi:Protein of unknown function (DUF1573)
MKIKFIILTILVIGLFFSCNNSKHSSEDEKTLAIKKIPKEKYSKIDCPFEIDMDTITTDKITTNLVVKNVGKNKLTNLFVKTTCDCTTLGNYPTELNPDETMNVKIAIDIEKKGYFCKIVYVIGTFNPAFRAVQIVGYKK